MEPLLHYILPLTALILLGEKPRTAAILATLGVASDIDALLLIHRSLSHSLVIIGLIYTPLFVYAWHRKPELQRTFILAFLVSASHPGPWRPDTHSMAYYPTLHFPSTVPQRSNARRINF